MSQSISLVCHKSITLASFHDYLQKINSDIKPVFTEGKKELTIYKDPDWYIIISSLNEDLIDLAVSELNDFDGATDEFKSKLVTYSIFTVTFNNYEIMKKIIKEILLRVEHMISEFWIDNDYGVVIQGNIFLSKLQNDPNWDWRSEEI